MKNFDGAMKTAVALRKYWCHRDSDQHSELDPNMICRITDKICGRREQTRNHDDREQSPIAIPQSKDADGGNSCRAPGGRGACISLEETSAEGKTHRT